MAVAANDQQARQRQAQFRADHMHDALAAVVEPEQRDAVIGGVLSQLADHARDFGIGDRPAAAARRHVMVGDAECQLRLRHRRAALRQPAESVERAFVHVMAVDPKQRLRRLRCTISCADPELVEQGQRRGHAAIPSAAGIAVERLILYAK